MKRPEKKEASGYFWGYIDQVPEMDFLKVLRNSLVSSIAALDALSESRWDYRYDTGKWSIKEAWLHVIDTERIMAYRALRIARNDKTPLVGFEQDDYVPYSDAENRSPASILREFEAVRIATLRQFEYYDEEVLNRLGTASNSPFSVRALGFIIAGHERHHMKIINERYLS